VVLWKRAQEIAMKFQSPIRLALVGSGIFARDAHLPALAALPNLFEVAAIYSRSAEKVAALAARLPTPVDTYTDLPLLLSRKDIEAVDIVLPILIEPAVILDALKSGKHVISEKPVAADVAAGQHLLHTAGSVAEAASRVWMVAENFRFNREFGVAGEIIRRGDIGQIIQFCWTTYANVSPQDQYYHTAWRRANNFPGGFVLDKGVHNMAAMRTMLGEVETVFAFVSQVRPDLPPIDTLNATLRFESGVLGTFTMTVAAAPPWGDSLTVVGDKGSLRIVSSQLEMTVAGLTTTQSFKGNNVQDELTAFARAIRQGEPLVSSPQQALQDVALIQAMLESARTGLPVKPQRIV
jgi:predicted dehydrogenase